MNILIVGYGFVGKAVDHGFARQDNDILIVDPHSMYYSSIDDIRVKNPHWIPRVVFLCLPTPPNQKNGCDGSLVIDALNNVIEHYPNAKIIIKSTITPDIASQCQDIKSNVICNPEFLRAATAYEDFRYPQMHVVGTKTIEDYMFVRYLYDHYSTCASAPFHHVSVEEASMIKYAINTFLAMKVTWANEMKQLIDQSTDGNWDIISSVICGDNRIGNSHLAVPGADGLNGYGGACFPKDTKALLSFAKSHNVKVPLLETTISSNEKYRESNI